jgi:hypothetical protein
MDISDKIQEMISNDSDMLLDSSDKKYIRFIPKELDFIPNEAIGWTKSNRILLFEIRNNPNSIELYLMIGPGNQELREELYRVVQNNPTLFSNATKKLSKTWFTCHKTNILRYEEEDYDVADILDGIINFFNRFKKNQLQDMINAFVSGYKIKQDASKE